MSKYFQACDHVTQSHAVNKFTPDAHTRSIVLVMNTQQILVIVIIVAVFISVVLVSFLVTSTHTLLLPPNTKMNATKTVFQERYNNKIQDIEEMQNSFPFIKQIYFLR